MNKLVKPGKYVVAVSGGVDSVVLLDMLVAQNDCELVVAHFDHGIRTDSKNDRQFVQQLATKYGLPFEFAEGKLGAGASEAVARKARYDFLFSVIKKHRSSVIVTAHHQADVLETLIINLLRGTGRKGLSSLRSQPSVLRPLLDTSKIELINYAKAHNLNWHEDSTNLNENYLRNWVRLSIMPLLSDTQKQQLLQLQAKAAVDNQELDILLDGLLGADKLKLQKNIINNLSHKAAIELTAHWLRINNVEFDSKVLEQIVVLSKTLCAGKTLNIKKNTEVIIKKDYIELIKL